MNSTTEYGNELKDYIWIFVKVALILLTCFCAHEVIKTLIRTFNTVLQVWEGPREDPDSDDDSYVQP